MYVCMYVCIFELSTNMYVCMRLHVNPGPLLHTQIIVRMYLHFALL